MRRRPRVVAALLLLFQLLVAAVAGNPSHTHLQFKYLVGIRQGSTDPVYASLFSPTPAPTPAAKANWVPPTPTASAVAAASPSPSASPSPEAPASAETSAYDVYYLIIAKSTKLSDNALQSIRNESAKAMGVLASAWELSSSSAKASSNTSSGTVLHYIATIPKNLAAAKVDKLTSIVTAGGLLSSLAAYSLPDGISAISLESAPQLSSGSGGSRGSSRIGIIVGCVVVVIALMVAAFFLTKFLRRRKSRHDSFNEKALNAAPPDFDDSHFGGDVARTTSAERVNPTGNPLDLSKQYRIAEWQEGAAIPAPISALANRKSGGVGSQRTLSSLGAGKVDTSARSYIAQSAAEGKLAVEPWDGRRADDAGSGHRVGTGSGRLSRAGTGIARVNSSSDYNESVTAISDYAESSNDLVTGSFKEPWGAMGDEGHVPSFTAKPERQGTRYPSGQDPSVSFLVGRLHPGQHSGHIEPDDNRRYRR
jgi:hypothetical protein